MSFKYQPRSKEFQNNPFAVYRKMREEKPIYFTNNNYAVLTRYEDVASTLRNPNVSVNFMEHCVGKAAEYVRPIKELREKNDLIGSFTTMLRSDEPAHSRMKHLTLPHFSHANILQLAQKIEKIVDKRLSGLTSSKAVNIVREVSQNIPVDTIFIILGLPDEDKEKLTRWAHNLTLIVEPLQSTGDGMQSVMDMLPETITYLVEKVEERRANPRENDVVTDLVTLKVNDEYLPYEEVLSTVGLLFMAGIETTMFFLANAIYTLSTNEKARKDWMDITSKARQTGDGFYSDKQVMNAIDELLRHSGSVWMTGRVNLEDFYYEVDGADVVVPKGSIINTVMAAANRDPSVFENPDDVDLYRYNASKQLTFSAGPHYCLGSHLARLEAAILLERIFVRFPDIKVVEEPIWRNRLTFRGIEDLFVDLH